MTDENKVASTKGPGWTRYVLIGSLALNLIILGMVGGQFLGGGRPERDPNNGVFGPVGLQPYAQGLSTRDKTLLRSGIEERRDSLRRDRRALRAQMTAFSAALSAQPFVAGDVEKVLAEQRASVGAQMAAGHEALLERVIAMTDEERAAFAEKLVRRLRPKPRD